MSGEKAAGAAAKTAGRALAGHLRSALPDLPPLTASSHTMVHELRLLAGGTPMSHQQLESLRRSATSLVTGFLDDEAKAAQAAGRVSLQTNLGTSSSVIARTYVDLVGASSSLMKNLPRRGPAGVGREGSFNGALFQILLTNHVALHRQLSTTATEHTIELNRLIASSGAMIDLDGKPLALTGSFGRPVKAVDFWLSTPTGKPPRPLNELRLLGDSDFEWDEFIDCGYVTTLKPAGGMTAPWWSLAVGLEIKRAAAAASDMSRQLGSQLGRLSESEMIKMRIAGSDQPLIAPTRALAFAPDNRWLIGATASLTNHEDYAFVTTRQGGYQETYLLISLLMDTSSIDRLSGLMFRAKLP